MMVFYIQIPYIKANDNSEVSKIKEYFREETQVQHGLSRRALCWMNPVIVRGVHWVRLVPVWLLTCYQALQHQHTCIQIHLTVVRKDSIWDRNCERHLCSSLGNMLSWWVFVYRKWLTGSTLSGQPGSTTYRWPSLGRVTRRLGQTEAGREIVMAFCNTPVFI